MSLTPGTRIGTYEVHGLLGRGGMGEVYRARDTRLKRDVAVKVLPQEVTADAERLARFAREAEILASLNHPNIGAIYGLERGDGFDALVLELIEGPSLADVIASRALPVTEAVGIARQIAAAMQAAHQKGIAHRDLKPANIKLTPAGLVKVLDFGLAKAYETPGEQPPPDLSTVTAVSRPGMIIGTVAYMAPEQVRGVPSGKAGDVWAFGCVLYEMLTGARAFSGHTMPETIAAVLTSEIDFHRLPAETPIAVRRLLRRCLQRDVDKRLRDLGDACLDLDEADAAHDELPAPARPASMTGGRRAAVIAAAIVVVAAAGVIGKTWAARAPAAAPLRKFDLAIPGLPNAPVAFPKVSPDGAHLAYVAAGKLWVRDLATLGSHAIFDDLPTLFFWSPDGAQIGFATGDKLMRASVEGGTPIAVATLPGLFGSSGWGGTWTNDGRMVIAQAGGGSALLTVPATGGTLTPLVKVDRGDLHEPAALPGRNVILYTIHQRHVEVIAAFDGAGSREVVRVDGETLRHPVYSPTGHLLYERTISSPGIWAVAFDADSLTTRGEPFLVVPDGSAPSVGADGTLSYTSRGETASILASIRSDGSVAAVTEAIDGTLQFPSFSPDRTRVVAALVAPGAPSAVVVFDLARKARWRVTTGTQPEQLPFWLPDGRVVGFTVQSPTDGTRIVTAPADGSRAPVTVAGNASWGAATRDLTQLLFVRRGQANQGVELWRSAPDGQAQKVLDADAGVQVSPQLSPDGRWLAYMSFTAGSFDVFLRQFPDGAGPWRISQRSGAHPRWSHTGDRLYYVESPGRLMQVDITTGPPVTIGTPRPALTREPQDAFLTAGFDLTADGAGFLTVARVTTGRPSSIVVVQNWVSEFSRR